MTAQAIRPSAQSTSALLTASGFTMKPGIRIDQEWSLDNPSTRKFGEVVRVFINRVKEWRAYDIEGVLVARGENLWELPAVL